MGNKKTKKKGHNAFYTALCYFFKNNSKKRIAGTVFCVFFVLLCLTAVIGISSIIDLEAEVIDEEDLTGFVDIVDNDEDDEKENIEALNELKGAKDLSTLLKEWALSSSEENLMKSKHVLNFLIIGVDEAGSNSDVIMLASLNDENKTIYLTSFFRDSYTYINTKYGDKYAKINAAYANGGAEKLIETLQNDYKIEIDHYVSVGFQSFVKIVNILGGVNVTVQPYEAKAVGLDCPSGENVLLNGEQALMFCRIRKCDTDGDVSRTRRQRMFISAIIDKTKEVSLSQATSMLTTLLDYIRTDCSSAQLISYASQAFINKWYSYEIVSLSVPSLEHRMDYSGNSWVWIVDYPAAAKELHETIYGYSNIELAENRVTAIDIMKKLIASGNAGI